MFKIDTTNPDGYILLHDQSHPITTHPICPQRTIHKWWRREEEMEVEIGLATMGSKSLFWVGERESNPTIQQCVEEESVFLGVGVVYFVLLYNVPWSTKHVIQQSRAT